ncbi:MAG: DUF554 domain-containing protein [Ruminococcaceae bacterium]|nr:DUF554 domain-containing protein [Oscillospiraceae bacterium]
MPGLGTIVNVVAIILGAGLGMLFGKKINEKIRTSLTAVLGLSVMFVGASGAMSGMLKAVGTDGSIETYGTMMMIISLVVGTLIGEVLKIEDRLEKFGEWIKKKVHAHNEQGFVPAFVNTSLVVCVGAMAVVGSVEDGLLGSHTTLFAKALLDFLIVIMMASTMGLGCLFSFVPVGILQGSITALSKLAEPVLSYGTVIADLSLVGSVMIFAVGVNLAFGKKFRVGNMLPSLIIAVAYSAASAFFGFSI